MGVMAAVVVLIVLALFFSGVIERTDEAINNEFGLHYPPWVWLSMALGVAAILGWVF